MKEVWGKDGKVYYVDDNGNRLQSSINPLQKFGRQIQAGLTNINDWINESDPNSEAYKQKANLVLGLSTMPIGGGLLSNVGANLLKPYIGKKMAQTVAQGVGSGATGGAVEGFGRGVIEGKNPLKTMATDATIGALTGGATGYGLSKIAKHLEGKQIFNNPLKQDEYYNNYVEGLKRADKLGQESPLSKGLAEYTALRDGFKYKPSSKVGLFDLLSKDMDEKIENLQATGGYSDIKNKSNRAIAAELEGKDNISNLAKKLNLPSKDIKNILYSDEWHHTNKNYTKTNYYYTDAYLDLKNNNEISQKTIEKYDLTPEQVYGIQKSWGDLQIKLKASKTDDILEKYKDIYKNDTNFLEKLNKVNQRPKKNDEISVREIRALIDEYKLGRIDEKKLADVINFWSTSAINARKFK